MRWHAGKKNKVIFQRHLNHTKSILGTSTFNLDIASLRMELFIMAKEH